MLALLMLPACSDYTVSKRQEFMNDIFIVDGGGTPSDVLFFMDTSCSMLEELQDMADHIVPFVSRLSSFSDDWQLAAAMDRSGCSVSGVLTPDDEYFSYIFANTVTDPHLWTGKGEEEGLFSVTAAVTAIGEGQCNEGLVRDDAMLHVIFISDERDQSLGFQTSDDYWLDYANFMMDLKGPDRVRFSAVIGPTPTGCSRPNTWADPGFGYDELVDYTGGEVLSICEEWAEDVEILANVTAQQTTFVLSRIPKSETLLVHIDEEFSSAWSWAPEENAVVLDEPAVGGTKVEINYEVDLDLDAER